MSCWQSCAMLTEVWNFDWSSVFVYQCRIVVLCWQSCCAMLTEVWTYEWSQTGSNPEQLQHTSRPFRRSPPRLHVSPRPTVPRSQSRHTTQSARLHLCASSSVCSGNWLSLWGYHGNKLSSCFTMTTSFHGNIPGQYIHNVTLIKVDLTDSGCNFMRLMTFQENNLFCSWVVTSNNVLGQQVEWPNSRRLSEKHYARKN